MKKLWIIVPCYNEEEVLPSSADTLKNVLLELIKKDKVSPESKVVFVNDGSKDSTWEIIKKLHEENCIFVGINLAHNKGHQNAVLAGLLTAKDYADVTVTIDADLQDDVTTIEQMIDMYNEGTEIVYGVRSSRKEDTFFKRFSAQAYYKLLAKFGVETVYNHADYRLMGKKSLEALAEYSEVNLYLRGIVPQLGFKTGKVSYDRKKRELGKSKYSMKKMFGLAWEGVTSFSTKPLKIAFLISTFTGFISFVLLLLGVILHFSIGKSISLYMICSTIFFIGSLITFCLGILGEYVGKMYAETKHRPRYIIDEILLDK